MSTAPTPADRWRFLTSVEFRLEATTDEAATAAEVVRLAAATIADTAVLVLQPVVGQARWWRATGVEGNVLVDDGFLPYERLPIAVRDALAGFQVEMMDWLDEELVDLGWVARRTDRPAAAHAVPVSGLDLPVAVLVVQTPAGPDVPEADTADLIRAFAGRASTASALSALRQTEQRFTAALTELRHPAQPPALPQVEWGTTHLPGVTPILEGHDFCGAYPLPGTGALAFIGSVLGDSVRSTIVAGQLRLVLATLRHLDPRPADVLHLLNSTLLTGTPQPWIEHLATLIVAAVRPSPAGVQVCLAGAGQPPFLVVHTSGEVEAVNVDGHAIGVAEPTTFGTADVVLEPGESVVFYGRGLIDAYGGHRGAERYGVERLVTALRGTASLPAPALVARIRQLAVDWRHPAGRTDAYHPDLTTLVVRARKQES